MNLIDPPHDIKNLNTVLWWQVTHISFIGEKSIIESLISDLKGCHTKFVFKINMILFNSNSTSQTIIMVQTS